MKKLCLVLGLAGLLSMPSIVFGEATWYGSFRGGVESAGGSSHMFSNGSRWGVKGSNEISEGLTANYRYEEALNLANATLADGNRLSYVGLSGGFGTISIGRIWSASFNSVGAILDNSYVYGTGGTSYRVGPAVSYSNSAGAASLQVDLVMDGDNDSKSGVDHYEFGLSFDLGAATLAFAHRKRNLAAVTETNFVEGTAGTPTTVVVTPGTAGTPTQVSVVDGTPNTPTGVTVVAGTAGIPPVYELVEGTGTAGTPARYELVEGTGTAGVPAEYRLVEGTGTAGRPAVPNVLRVVPPQVAVRAMPATQEATSTSDYLRLNNPESALPIAGLTTRADCVAAGHVYFNAAGANTGGTCYNAAHGVTVTKNPIKSILDASDEKVAPISSDTEATKNVHRSLADCVAHDAGNLYEPNTGMCYPAATVFTYITVDAKEAVQAVEAHHGFLELVTPGATGEAGEPARYELVEGTGTAGVPAQYALVEGTGTAGSPSRYRLVAGTGMPNVPTEVEVDEGEAGEPTVVTVVDGTTGTVTQVEVTPGTPSTPSKMVTTTTTPAHDETMNAVAVRFAAGSHSAAVGLVKTSNSMGGESSTTIANAGGPLSDGLSYHFQVRDTEGSASNPWLVGLSKSLGGGSSVILEHADEGDENKTAVYLQVDF